MRVIPDVGGAVEAAVRVVDVRLGGLVAVDARLVRLLGGCTWAEGPVYLPGDGAVRFSDIPNDRAMEWHPDEGGRVVRQPDDFTNGQTLDLEGRIVHCEQGERRVSRTEHDGTRRPLVDHHASGRLNSPNDVIVARDGAIWFTDPPYGILSDYEGHKAPSEQAACHVFRLDPITGELTAVSDDLIHPNGLAFSPDERLLYVADSSAAVDPQGNRHILVFDVVDSRRLRSPRLFSVIEPGIPDGMRVDEHGNIWTSALDGIHVLDPQARELGRILVPERTGNCVFGGPDGRRLFITASSSLYAIDVLVRGAGIAAAVARGEPLAGADA